jgi:hypothetical protein
MAKFSKLNAAPAACHYAVAKRVFCYLRESETNSIFFWCRVSHPSLPHAPLAKRSLDATDLLVPYSKEMGQLVGYMDAAHGKCLRTSGSVCVRSSACPGKCYCTGPSGLLSHAPAQLRLNLLSRSAEASQRQFFRSILNQLGILQRGWQMQVAPRSALTTSISNIMRSCNGCEMMI